MEVLLEASWGVLGHLEAILGVLKRSFRDSGPSGIVLGASSAHQTGACKAGAKRRIYDYQIISIQYTSI